VPFSVILQALRQTVRAHSATLHAILCAVGGQSTYGAAVDARHTSRLYHLIVMVVLNNAEGVDPQILVSQFSGKRYSVLERE
jgi:hypothetical protein